MKYETPPAKKKKYVASSCWNGNHYANHSDWQFDMASKALSFLQIPPKAKILDIGCGDGRFTKCIATLAPDSQILGLDPSLSMLETAKSNVTANLSFVFGDAMHLTFEEEFDRIVAFNSLHWVSEIQVALDGINKALKPGGEVLILVAPIQVRYPLHQIICEVAKKNKWNGYFESSSNLFSFHTFGNWAAYIEAAGLIPERIELIDASSEIKDKKTFAGSLEGWIPFGSIPENQKQEYIQDIVDSYISVIPCSPNGVVHYLLDELVIVASKPKVF